MTEDRKLNIQLVVAVALCIIGVILLMMGFWVFPTGQIHDSVLIAFGEICTFSGGLFGIDYNYKYKRYVSTTGKHQHYKQPIEKDNALRK